MPATMPAGRAATGLTGVSQEGDDEGRFGAATMP